MRGTRRDRGSLLTRTLLGLGLALLGIVVLVLVLRPPHGRRPPPATTASQATTAPQETPQPPIAAVSVTPFAATVEWRTPEPTTGRLAAALAGGGPTLWSEPVGPARDHRATIGGLALGSDYRFTAGDLTLDVHTPAA